MAALLASRPSALVAKRAGVTRTCAVRATPRPFMAVPSCQRRVFARAQEADAPAVSDEELASLVEEEDDVIAEMGDIDAVYAAMTGADEEEENEVAELTDEEMAAALQAAELLGTDGFDALTAAEITAEVDEDEEQQDYSTFYALKLLEDKLAAGDITAEELSEITAGLDEDETAEAVELEDGLAAENSDRYAEVAATAEDKEAMANIKLSRPELRNLVPEDWDQINTEFFANKKDEDIPLPEFRLNVLWTDENLAVAIDQVYSRGQVSPLTEYYFWPRQDAWDDLRINLEGRPWISDRDRIILLNRLTQLINYWQDEEVKHSVDEARTEFPDCAFAIA